MATQVSELKDSDVEQVEKVDVLRNQAPAPHHYEPITEEEKALDRKINLKLDVFVTLILSVGFILCGSKSLPKWMYAQINREETRMLTT
jgi:hypothetical protein